MKLAVRGPKDFDFEIGLWAVKHRRLKERLVDCREWEEFNGASDMRTILGGNGNVEDNIIEAPDGTYRAIALRSFDPSTNSWAIWWLSSLAPQAIDVPVVGSFENGNGSFFASDVLRGSPIQVRFLWLKTDTGSPRWEQAMSADQGQTWETNWTMDFRRS
jgi:streptogramin lyase